MSPLYFESEALHAAPVLLDGRFALLRGIVGAGEQHALVSFRFLACAHATGLPTRQRIGRGLKAILGLGGELPLVLKPRPRFEEPARSRKLSMRKSAINIQHESVTGQMSSLHICAAWDDMVTGREGDWPMSAAESVVLVREACFFADLSSRLGRAK